MADLQVPTDFFVEDADYVRDLDALRAVREPVFVVEQKVPADLEWDELDPRSKHVLARDLQHRPIGTGRLTPVGKIGRMAVLPEWRGKGVGAVMLTRLIDLARTLGYTQVELHAQVSAIGFYEKFGFVAFGDEYEEAGIQHRSMRLDLAARPPLLRKHPPVGAESTEIEFQTLDACRDLTLELLRSARHKLWIYSRDLDPTLFSGEAIVAELRRIATSGRGAEIHILLQDPAAAVRQSPPLLHLAQRLSSAIQIRQPQDEIDRQYAAAFLLNDQAGLLFRPLGGRFEGAVQPHAPGHHRQLLAYFGQVWERSMPPAELRSLGI